MDRSRWGLRTAVTSIAPQAGWAVALLCVALWATHAYGYQYYDDDPSPMVGQGCVTCHPGFTSNGPLHQNHRNLFGISQCNLCHPSGGGSKPVQTYWSGPGGGLGCAGCHGRDYGETSPNSGEAKATGYGLRKFHIEQKGIMTCGAAGGCHVADNLGHPDPLPTPLPENVPPPYYGQATNNLTDPCSSAQEDLPFDADSVGLDNDGDGNPDYPADSDCMASPTPTPTATATPTVPFNCAAAPVGGCIAPGKAILLVNEKKADKEKLKVVLKKLQPTVAQNQFGDPVSGITAYKVCIYDAANSLSGEYTVAQAGAMCGDKPCWKTISSKGYKYKDKGTAADGILKIKLVGGDAGKGKVVVVGKNKTSTLPTGVAAALENEASATVQVLSNDASCFGQTLTRVKKADGLIFKALEP